MQGMGQKAIAQSFKRIISKVEVERKFNPGPDFVSTFLSKDCPTQPFRVYNARNGSSFVAVRRQAQIIRDIYYDTQNDQLSKLGLWVRQRHVQVLASNAFGQKNGDGRENTDQATSVLATDTREKLQWNAKLRLGGHFNDSQFVEFDGMRNVSDEVLRITGSKTKLEDLQVVTDLRTRRSLWEVPELDNGKSPLAKMTIVLDEVNEATILLNMPNNFPFAHTIGEVELFEEFVTEGNDKTEHEAQRANTAEKRMKELETFMVENAGLFATTPAPVGKLSAYYTWKKACNRVFVHALNTVKKIPKTGASRPPPADRLRLYGLYKQAMEGDVDGVMERPRPGTGLEADELQREKDKWDAWNCQSGLSRTEAKRRYVEALIDTMHRYATTPDASELVAELEFVWNQIKSNSPSSSNSSPKGRSSFAEPQRFQRPSSGTDGPMKVLSPMSEDDAPEHRYRDKQDDDGDGDYVKKGDRWSRKVEQALMRLSAEIAALREQITTGREWRAKKERSIPTRIGWVLGLVAKHLAIDVFILVIILIWMRRRKDPRLEEQVRAILRIIREYARKILPSR
ncbi:acyl CoA binding protein-domain-containing protein [Xylaria venustula]|nr:acyl CoA binding protein-domain-containing protein [Xylaria venustula]